MIAFLHKMRADMIHCIALGSNRAFQSVVFNIGQKLALRAVYIVICLSSFEVKCSQRHLSAAIEDNRLQGPIHFFNFVGGAASFQSSLVE